MSPTLLQCTLPALGVLASAISLSSCTKAPDDPFCSYEAVPASTEIAAGEGAIQIVAPTDEYFHVLDAVGKEIKSGAMNRAVNVKSGQYNVKVNNSAHSVRVDSKMLTKCSTAVVRVSGDTDEYYHVSDAANTQLASQKLGRALAFFPGTYQVNVNKSSASADLKQGSTSEMKAGLINVRGTTDEYYHVFDAAGTELAANKLARPLSFLAGSFVVKVNGTSAPATIKSGAATDAATGALLVLGTTDEYYHVFDTVGNELASNKLGKALSFMPANYSVKVNNAPLPVAVEAGKTNEYQTGTLTVKRSGDEYYHVSDHNGTELGSAKLNNPMALVAGNYSVKLGSDTKPVAIAAGQSTVVNW
jgi:hypothetical protein